MVVIVAVVVGILFLLCENREKQGIRKREIKNSITPLFVILNKNLFSLLPPF